MEEGNKMHPVKPIKGMAQDFSPIDQPENTYIMGLNIVKESIEGDISSISSEESNRIFAEYKPDYIPIGKRYMRDGNIAILSVSKDNTISEIGILNTSTGYTTHVNDADSPEIMKLGFKVENQIDVLYRLRLGCEDTIYFTDFNKRPCMYNFSSPESFKNRDGLWDRTKFFLQKSVSKLPVLRDIEVLDSGGNTEPGGYNISIRMVDDNMNPTEWLLTTNVVKIYNDLSTKNFPEIRGSINLEEDAVRYPKTGKAIKTVFTELDNGYPFYQLAFIASNSGNGTINDIFITDVLSTDKPDFTFTGDNFREKGTIEEIKMFSGIIYGVKYMEQVDNRLLLANVKGPQTDFCLLQKYASKITSDCITKEIRLSDINDIKNPKNPVHEFYGGLGNMPGEIYSYAIVYIFDDFTESPAFHIPGKLKKDSKVIFSQGDNVFPMSGDNESASSTYTDNDASCSPSGSMWGVDYSGLPLLSRPIRHHRFPTRKEIGVPLISASDGNTISIPYYILNINITGNIIVPVPCPEGDANCVPEVLDEIPIEINYKLNGEDEAMYIVIDPNEYFSDTLTAAFEKEFKSKLHNTDDITDIVIKVPGPGGLMVEFTGPCNVLNGFEGNICINTSVEEFISENTSKDVRGYILGIRFSNIELPQDIDSSGRKIIGYYIVRNERLNADKTVLDSGVLFPTLINGKYISSGLIYPEVSESKISKKVFSLLTPEHKFYKNEYTSFSKIEQDGEFSVVDRKYSKVTVQDVEDGSSFNRKKHRSGNDDGGKLDGWSLDILSRDNIVDYRNIGSDVIEADDIENTVYLPALGNITTADLSSDIWNISADNRIGIIQLKEDREYFKNSSLPYVYLRRENADPYSDFRLRPYYKESKDITYFSNNTESSTDIYNGDTYISPIRYLNTMFWDNRVAKRAGKKGVLKIVLGITIAVVGVVLSIFTAGLSTPLVYAGIAIAGAGALMASSGIKQDKYNKAYNEEYNKGLRETVLDNFVSKFYQYKNTIPFGFSGNGGHGPDGPTDDSIQWVADCVTDLWFETTVNTHLRHGFLNDESPTFLNSPWKIETGNTGKIGTWEYHGIYYTGSDTRGPISSLDKHLLRKLTAFDDTRGDNKRYLGVPLGEYYEINPDYLRRNKEKEFFHLPIEYDCCSDCTELYPHRVHYSEQSFQETLSDNYRVFLPNNYRDIEGDSGEITNIYRLGSTLYVHTEEALWVVPRMHQERITDQVVSFIGTGEFFAVPPEKIIEDETGNSVGSTHKWGTTKFQNSILFQSAKQGKIYIFDGKSPKPISSTGMFSWFNQNMGFICDTLYERNNGVKYPHNNNPSNPLGTGFISSYDAIKERLIITKKDFIPTSLLDEVDYQVVSFNGSEYIFRNQSKIISDKLFEGFVYEGIVGNKMSFKKEIISTTQEVVKETIVIPGYEEEIFTPNGCTKYSRFEIIYNIPANGAGSGDDWQRAIFVRCDGTEEYFDREGTGNLVVSGCYSVTGSFNSDDVINEVIEYDPYCSNEVTIIVHPPQTIVEEKIIDKVVITYEYSEVEGELLEQEIINASWTMSYSLKDAAWVSYHSYLPEIYFSAPNKLYSWKNGKNSFWEHNIKGTYQRFYGERKQSIIEFVYNSNPITTRIIDYICIQTQALKYNEDLKDFYEERFITFNKALFYNSRQCSGILNLVVKDLSLTDENYLLNQVQNLSGDSIIIDRTETDWFLNQIRDIRTNYNTPIFNTTLEARQDDYFIDKVVNTTSLDIDKPWYEQESFRDKYLVVRLIFDNFEDVKLIFNFSFSNEIQSPK